MRSNQTPVHFHCIATTDATTVLVLARALLSVLMRPFCYYRGKAKLAGLFGVPLFLLVLIGGYAGYQNAASNITPATVVFREYVKSDGTHVSGYNRRPPGSVPHDQPYEYIQFSAFIAILGATFWTGRSIYWSAAAFAAATVGSGPVAGAAD
jgi:hypothetical protein